MIPTPEQINASSLYGDTLIGLVDIGSNSIRLVIYRGGGRLPHPQFNEREVCRLGEGVTETGRLAQERVDHALATLGRFAIIIANSRLDRIDIFATEAVRRAANKDDFLRPAEAILGHPIRVLEGFEEAIYAARGVISGFVHVDGIVADLGGGSLELTEARPGRPLTSDYSVSLPLGHLVAAGDVQINRMIAGVDWLTTHPSKRLYVVGGVWRAIATAYAAQSRKRVDIVHGLTMTEAEIMPLFETIEAADGEVHGIPPARRGSMAQAIKVMRGLLKAHGTREIIFSSYGAREGILYDGLDAEARRVDPLLAGVAEYGEMYQRFDGLGEALMRPMAALIEQIPRPYQRLAQAACWLADIAWLEYPDYRGSLAAEKMLGMSVVGITHAERVWLAATLNIRYMGMFPRGKIFRGLLTRKERKSALFIGLALRMLMSASGGIPAIIDAFEATAHAKRHITISLPHAMGGLDTPLLRRRLCAISDNSKIKIDFAIRGVNAPNPRGVSG